MQLLGSIMLLASLLAGAFHYNEQLALKEDLAGRRRWFKNWAIRGLGVPLLLWFVFNLGSTPVLPAMFPTGKAGATWFGRMLILSPPAVMIISSYWAALTFGWLLFGFAAQTGQKKQLVAAGLGWAVLMSPLVAVALFVGRLEGLGLAFMPLLVPLLFFASREVEELPPPTPLYARAIGELKMGRYANAEKRVLEELEKCQDDFDGWMMLADLYANHFHDLLDASRTIRDIVGQPQITPSQIAVAYHRLADWHLKANDPASARRALEEIGRRLPGSHLAHMAQLRLKQLPATQEEFAEQSKPRSVRMPALNDTLDQPAENAEPRLDKEKAALLANECVAKLKANPNDVPAREKLARLLAEDLGKAGAGLGQLELLMGMPGQPEEKMAGWLALAAAWQITYRKDNEAAKGSLRRLLQEYPQTPQAFAAQRRLNLIEMDERLQKAREAGKTTKERLRISTEGLDGTEQPESSA